MPELPNGGDKDDAKRLRKTYAVDQLMNQFKKLESGIGNSPEFTRGYVWNFEWCSENPEKAQPEKVARVRAVMSGGVPFDEAFDAVSAERPPAKCCGCVCGFCEHQGGDNIHSTACAERLDAGPR